MISGKIGPIDGGLSAVWAGTVYAFILHKNPAAEVHMDGNEADVPSDRVAGNVIFLSGSDDTDRRTAAGGLVCRYGVVVQTTIVEGLELLEIEFLEAA